MGGSQGFLSFKMSFLCPGSHSPRSPICITDSKPLLPTFLGLLPQTSAAPLCGPDATTLILLVILVWDQYRKQEGMATASPSTTAAVYLSVQEDPLP